MPEVPYWRFADGRLEFPLKGPKLTLQLFVLHCFTAKRKRYTRFKTKMLTIYGRPAYSNNQLLRVAIKLP